MKISPLLMLCVFGLGGCIDDDQLTAQERELVKAFIQENQLDVDPSSCVGLATHTTPFGSLKQVSCGDSLQGTMTTLFIAPSMNVMYGTS